MIDESLCYKIKYIDETWLSREKEQESFADSLAKCLAGGEPANWEEYDAKQATKKGKAKGLRGLSKAQREKADRKEIAGERQAERKESKLLDLVAKAAKMASDGKTWREVYKALNLDREKSTDKEKVKKAYTQGK